MDKRYVNLFKELALTSATLAEQVMDYDRQKEDEAGLATATQMRDDFQALADRISENGENYAPDKSDAAKLLVSSMLIVNQLNDKLNNIKKSITGYQTDLIPKLQDIVDNAESDDAAREMANAKFIIEDNE